MKLYLNTQKCKRSLVSGMNKPRKEKGVSSIVVIAVVIVIVAAVGASGYILLKGGGAGLAVCQYTLDHKAGPSQAHIRRTYLRGQV